MDHARSLHLLGGQRLGVRSPIFGVILATVAVIASAGDSKAACGGISGAPGGYVANRGPGCGPGGPGGAWGANASRRTGTAPPSAQPASGRGAGTAAGVAAGLAIGLGILGIAGRGGGGSAPVITPEILKYPDAGLGDARSPETRAAKAQYELCLQLAAQDKLSASCIDKAATLAKSAGELQMYVNAKRWASLIRQHEQKVPASAADLDTISPGCNSVFPHRLEGPVCTEIVKQNDNDANGFTSRVAGRVVCCVNLRDTELQNWARRLKINLNKYKYGQN